MFYDYLRDKGQAFINKTTLFVSSSRVKTERAHAAPPTSDVTDEFNEQDSSPPNHINIKLNSVRKTLINFGWSVCLDGKYSF